MKKDNTLIESRTETVIGIDLGDKQSHVCVLGAEGNCVERGTVVTTPSGFKGRFERIDTCRIAIEAGGAGARELGHGGPGSRYAGARLTSHGKSGSGGGRGGSSGVTSVGRARRASYTQLASRPWDPSMAHRLHAQSPSAPTTET